MNVEMWRRRPTTVQMMLWDGKPVTATYELVAEIEPEPSAVTP